MGATPRTSASGGIQPLKAGECASVALARGAWIWALLLVSALHAEEPWSPSRQLDTVTVRDTALDSTGDRLAFTVRTVVRHEGQASWRDRVWVARSNGSRLRPVSTGDSDCFAPSFSSDGRQVAFLCVQDGPPQLWIRRLDAGPAHRVTDSPSGVARYRWSPIPTRLAYLATDVSARLRRPLAPSLKSVEPIPTHLFHLDLDLPPSGLPEAVQITWGTFHVSDFTWSPTGTRIAYSRHPDARADTARLASDLGVLNLAGRGLQRGLPLARLGGTEVGPRWSPDGRWIAFTASGERPDPIGLGDIHVVSADGTEVRKLAATPERAPTAAVGWNSSSTAVYVAEAAGTATHLLAVPLDGSEPVPQLEGNEHRSAFSISADGTTLAFSQEAPGSAPEVFIWRHARAPARVTALNSGSDLPATSPTEVLTWLSVDGLRIEGLLTRPVGLSEPGPLAVLIHGGPAARATASFTGSPHTFMVESLVAAGWSVLRVNYRGSTGYGPDFRHPPIATWGDEAADDIRSGIDELVSRRLVSRDAVFVAGWGYGAYLAVLLASGTNPPLAISIGAPLSDLHALATTTDIPSYLFAYFAADVWSNPELYTRGSLLHRLVPSTTPVQIFHGELDLRIPVEQSHALFNALRRAGNPSELLLLPDATGPPRLPEELVAIQSEIHRWWRRCLDREPENVVERPAPRPRRTRFVVSEYEPYGQSGDGAIEGVAYLEMPDGERRRCELALVFMNPVTTFSTEWYERNVLRREELEPADAPIAYRYHWMTRSDHRGFFRFVDLPPGDYYLGCRAIPTEGFAHGRATVRSGQTTYVKLTRRIGVEP